jgi:segregation and condensation protein B
MEELRRIIEALLFAAPEPLTVSRIKTIVPGTEPADIAESIEELRREYDESGRAFQVVEVANGWQLTSRPDYAIWVDKLFEARGKARLSRAALETLAVVAYKQPVVRSAIEAIRGVNVDSVLRTLMERDLVRIVGRADGPGRPLLFGTTKEFLLRFGISRISDLPKLEEIENLTGEKAAVVEGLALEEGGTDIASSLEEERAEYAEAAGSVEDMLREAGDPAVEGPAAGAEVAVLEEQEAEAGEKAEEGYRKDAGDDVAQGEA